MHPPGSLVTDGPSAERLAAGPLQCDRCGYDLSAAPGAGENDSEVKCPECGDSAPGRSELAERRRLRLLGVTMLVWGLPAWGSIACASVLLGKGWWRTGTPGTRSEVTLGQFGFNAGRSTLGLLPAVVMMAGLMCLFASRPRRGWMRRVCWGIAVGAGLVACVQFGQAATDSLTTGMQGLNTARRWWFFNAVSWAALVLGPACLGVMMWEVGKGLATEASGSAAPKTARRYQRAAIGLALAMLVVDGAASTVLGTAKPPVTAPAAVMTSSGWTSSRPLNLYEVGVWLSVVKWMVAAASMGVVWAAACVLRMRIEVRSAL